MKKLFNMILAGLILSSSLLFCGVSQGQGVTYQVPLGEHVIIPASWPKVLFDNRSSSIDKEVTFKIRNLSGSVVTIRGYNFDYRYKVLDIQPNEFLITAFCIKGDLSTDGILAIDKDESGARQILFDVLYIKEINMGGDK